MISAARFITRRATSLHYVRSASASGVLPVLPVRSFSSYPPHLVVGMPSLSPTMEAGTIVSWTKAEGESFGPGDSLCSIETDKATMDFEAQDDGIIAKILAVSGPDEIQCGMPIMITVEEEDDVAAFKDYVVQDTAEEPSTPEPTPEPEPVAAPPAPAPVEPTKSAAAPRTEGSGRVVASPLAHMLAKEKSFDLSKIMGTGPGGRIIAADINEYTPSAQDAVQAADSASSAPTGEVASSSTPPPIVGSGFTDYPISESAQEVATRLSQSKKNVPHYYLTVDICMDEVLAMKEKLSASMGEDKSVGVYDFMIKAAAASMKAVPSANASWMDTVVRVYDSVDINVVVGSGDELYTPVIRDCGSKGLGGIGDELNAAVSAFADGNVTSEFGTMGTMTVMNLGMYGIKSCAPIIREPQSVALAVGALENRIVPNDDVDGEEIYKESVMVTATLSCDHRVVDGAVGAQWLSAFKSHLEDPTTLLL